MLPFAVTRARLMLETRFLSDKLRNIRYRGWLFVHPDHSEEEERLLLNENLSYWSKKVGSELFLIGRYGPSLYMRDLYGYCWGSVEGDLFVRLKVKDEKEFLDVITGL